MALWRQFALNNIFLRLTKKLIVPETLVEYEPYITEAIWKLQKICSDLCASGVPRHSFHFSATILSPTTPGESCVEKYFHLPHFHFTLRIYRTLRLQSPQKLAESILQENGFF
jgi:hypothetical protein